VNLAVYIQNVSWLCVSTSGSYFCCYSQSEMPYIQAFCFCYFQGLQNYGWLKIENDLLTAKLFSWTSDSICSSQYDKCSKWSSAAERSSELSSVECVTLPKTAVSFTSLAASKIQQSNSSLVSTLCSCPVFLMWHHITGEGLGTWNCGHLKDSFGVHACAGTDACILYWTQFSCV
jgi:hypothetical protein